MEKGNKRMIQMHFQTDIENGAHSDSYEFTTTGELFHKGKSDYLRFKETLSETETVQSTMKWNGSELLLIRQGVILMRQAFVLNEDRVGRYVTPEASWETKARTEKLHIDWPSNGKKGEIQLTYQFELQGQHTGRHHIRLTLEEEISE